MAEEVRIRQRQSAKHGTTYEYRFETASIDGSRKWISKGGYLTEKEALKAGLEALKKYRTCGMPDKTSNMSYADFLDMWMETDCKSNLKEATLLNYSKRIKNHIKPELGSYQLNKIRRDRLQGFLQKKHDNGYAKNTLSTLRSIISKSMTYAVENGYLTESPAENLRIPRGEMTTVPTRSAPHCYLTADQMQRIFERFQEGCSSYLPLMIGYRCGLRIGEVYALTWEDIDLDCGKLTVSKQVQWKQNPRSAAEKRRNNGSRCTDSGFWYFSAPKCNSYRTIDLDSQLLEFLRRERNRQEQAEVYYRERYQRYFEDTAKHISQNPGGKPVQFICRRENGEYVNLRTMQYTTKIIHEELHLPEFDFHSLRHTHATMLVENGAPLKYIQQRLGHKRIEVTMNIYQHVTEALREQGNHVIENMF